MNIIPSIVTTFFILLPGPSNWHRILMYPTKISGLYLHDHRQGNMRTLESLSRAQTKSGCRENPSFKGDFAPMTDHFEENSMGLRSAWWHSRVEVFIPNRPYKNYYDLWLVVGSSHAAIDSHHWWFVYFFVCVGLQIMFFSHVFSSVASRRPEERAMATSTFQARFRPAMFGFLNWWKLIVSGSTTINLG